jgi:hypothetical protein
MTTAVKAVYEDGVFKPKEPVQLAEHAEVEVLIPTPPPPPAPDDPSGWKAIDQMIGFIKDAPPDMAENHDHYLYDWPRK